MRLKDKVALITGAGSGIGRQSALLFSREGAQIVVVDVNEQAARETAAMIPNAIAVRADVSKAGDCQAMVAAAEKAFGKLNVLFNNAGIMHAKDDDAVSTDESVWDLTLDINAKGVFLGCQYGIPALKRAGGDAADPLYREQGRRARHDARARGDPCATEHPRQCAFARPAAHRAPDELL